MNKTRDETAREVGTEVIGAPFTPTSIDEYYRETMRFGLTWDQAWLAGEVVTEDGKRYAFCRGYEKASTNLMLSQKLNPDLSKTSEKLYKHLYMGPMHFDKVEGKEMIVLKSYPAKNNFKIELEVNRFHWVEENGEIDLYFKALGPAFRWVSPAGKTNEELYYLAEYCEITGTVLGEAVTGFGSLEHDWLPPGIGWTQGKVYKYLQDFWVVFANRYEDGSVEYGLCQYGAGNWTAGFFVEDKNPYVSMDNEFKMDWAEEGYPREGAFRMGPHKFKWIVKSRLFEIKGNVIWATGQMINQARKDLPVHSYSWIEFRNVKTSFDPRETKD